MLSIQICEINVFCKVKVANILKRVTTFQIFICKKQKIMLKM